MRILWHSNAPWSPTGYGTQTAIMTTLLAQEHNVTISAFYGLQGGSLTWQDMQVLPPVRDAYGNDVILGHAGQAFQGDPKAGLTVSLIDVWVLNPQVWDRLHVAAWVPVDHDPAPPRVLEFFQNTHAVPLAMSRFGERMLAKHDPLYVPHGIPTDVFKPRDRQAARDITGLPQDKFLVGMVAANKGNPSRKSFVEAFRAFAEFRAKHPDAHLYLHTEALGAAEGMHLPRLLAGTGIPPEAVTFADQYAYQTMPVDPERLSWIYSAMDVLLAPSAGEGFGIPIIEAQACGTPVIVSDFSAMTELCGSGWLIGGDRVWTYQESWQHKPDHQELVWALGEAYQHADRYRGDAREFALGYDSERVMREHMLPALDEAWRRCQERPAELTPRPVAA